MCTSRLALVMSSANWVRFWPIFICSSSQDPSTHRPLLPATGALRPVAPSRILSRRTSDSTGLRSRQPGTTSSSRLDVAARSRTEVPCAGAGQAVRDDLLDDGVGFSRKGQSSASGNAGCGLGSKIGTSVRRPGRRRIPARRQPVEYARRRGLSYRRGCALSSVVRSASVLPPRHPAPRPARRRRAASTARSGAADHNPRRPASGGGGAAATTYRRTGTHFARWARGAAIARTAIVRTVAQTRLAADVCSFHRVDAHLRVIA
jgi:hypothetical protein